MNLYVYILNGTPINELDGVTVNQLGSNPGFIASDTSPSLDYVDISSIENWHEFGRRTNKDYLFVRNEIHLLYTSIGWSSLNVAEQNITIRLFVASLSERNQLFTIPQQLEFFIFHINRSQKTRIQRWEYVRANLIGRLARLEWQVVVTEINADQLLINYIDYNIRGTAFNDVVGIIDYIDSDNPYHTGQNGLRNKNYNPAGLADMDVFANRAIDILINGNY